MKSKAIWKSNQEVNLSNSSVKGKIKMQTNLKLWRVLLGLILYLRDDNVTKSKHIRWRSWRLEWFLQIWRITSKSFRKFQKTTRRRPYILSRRSHKQVECVIWTTIWKTNIAILIRNTLKINIHISQVNFKKTGGLWKSPKQIMNGFQNVKTTKGPGSSRW